MASYTADFSCNPVPSVDEHTLYAEDGSTLVFNYTMACPLCCDFCCYGCHPKRTEKMPLALACDLVRQAAAIPDITHIGFTGGDPLLYFDELLHVGTCLKKYRKPFTIATTGYWAESIEKASDVISSLVECGLARLNLSYDPSHARFISLDRILNAALSCEANNVDCFIVCTFYSQEERNNNLLPGFDGMNHVHVVDKWVCDAGRAKGKVLKGVVGDSYDKGSFCCPRQLHHDLVVFWDGAVYPCCSTFNLSTPGLLFGNVYDSSLRDLFTLIDGSLLLRVIKRHGFTEIYNIIKRYDTNLFSRLPSLSESGGACSLCNLILSPPLLTLVRALFDKYEMECLTEILRQFDDDFLSVIASHLFPEQ